MDSQSDRNDKMASESSKSVRSRKNYYSIEYNEKQSRSDSGERTAYSERLSSSSRQSSSDWEGRSGHQKNHLQTGSTQRSSSWFGRGAHAQAIHLSTPARTNTANFPVWMTPLTPQLPVFYPPRFVFLITFLPSVNLSRRNYCDYINVKTFLQRNHIITF